MIIALVRIGFAFFGGIAVSRFIVIFLPIPGPANPHSLFVRATQIFDIAYLFVLAASLITFACLALLSRAWRVRWGPLVWRALLWSLIIAGGWFLLIMGGYFLDEKGKLLVVLFNAVLGSVNVVLMLFPPFALLGLAFTKRWGWRIRETVEHFA